MSKIKMNKNEILEKYLTQRNIFLKRFILFIIIFLAISSLLLFKSKDTDFIAKVTIEGVITNPTKTLNDLDEISNSLNVKALLINVNSPGGTFVGSKELYDKIKEISEKIPVVTYMKEMATSGGYLVSLASEKVFGNIGTITGSIGVILQTAEITSLLEKIGINPVVIKSGNLKATPNPLEKINESESKYLNEIVKIMQDEFLKLVTENRKIEKTKLEIIADGRIFTGKQAMELNLIDFIGSEKDAIEWLKNEAKIIKEIDIIDYSKENNYEKLLNLNLLGRNINIFDTGVYNGFLAIWDPRL